MRWYLSIFCNNTDIYFVNKHKSQKLKNGGFAPSRKSRRYINTKTIHSSFKVKGCYIFEH